MTAFGIFRMITWLLRTRVGVLRAAARGEDVPVEIVAHRWDLLDTGEFTIVRKPAARPARTRSRSCRQARRVDRPDTRLRDGSCRLRATGRHPTRSGVAVGGGLLLVDKPSGCTSHDVVGRLRQVLRTRRIGHAGTLDPMATGLLVLAVDRSTKLLGHLALTDKTYLATIRLGQQTDTDDADGRDRRRVARRLPSTDDDIAAGVAALTGPLMQVPSSVSAIKVDGRRAYDRVRAGEDRGAGRPAGHRVPVRDPRRAAPATAGRRSSTCHRSSMCVDCTTGTYVRSLARDLGAALCVRRAPHRAASHPGRTVRRRRRG